jgi:opacity protein-like surface antigen
MPRIASLLLALLCVAAAASPAAAAIASVPQTAAADSCEAAGASAERAWNLPAGLLTAIGHMESGRFDPAGGRVVAWPWTINAAGQGTYFASKQDAIAAVAALRMRGVQSIDVGCFQVNLMYHPTAFASLDEAFDVRANAAYAARFLSELHARGGSWRTAVAWYHSATPGLGEAYRDRVLADWTGGGMRIGLRPAPPAAMGADPYVVRIAARVSGVRIWTPEATTRPAASHPILPAPIAAAWRGPARRAGLPRVITPAN